MTNGRAVGIDAALNAAGLPPLPRTAWLSIDLDALASNLAVIRRLAGPDVPVHPVVKADAYGHGALPVARALEAAGADGFCVATYDEAAALRAGGIQAPLLVLYPIPVPWVIDAARHGISITAGDPELLDATLTAASASSSRGRRALLIQLEVETGLGRGGFVTTALADAARAVERTGGARLAGLWTHLQAPGDRAVTAAQVAAFEIAAATLQAAGIRLPRRHLRASGSLVGSPPAPLRGGPVGSPEDRATLLDGGVSYDGVRPGLSIYGLVPDELAADAVALEAGRLRPALSLHARPVRVQDLPADWGISYGPSFRTRRPSRIATLPIGYGDGWPRALSNRAEALVRGVRVPTVGNVAMDAVMIDVTDVPGPPVTVGDTFTLIGRQGDESIPVAEVARARDTNSWEVVTAMARRLPRVYHAAAGPVAVRTLVRRGRR
jgi:alanine racemase